MGGKKSETGKKGVKEKLDRDQLYMGESFNSREREREPLEIDTHIKRRRRRVHNGAEFTMGEE